MLTTLALLASAGVKPGGPVLRLVGALVAVALAVKTLAFAILMQAELVFAWLTPGAQLGLAIGAVLAFAAMRLPRHCDESARYRLRRYAPIETD